MSKKEPSTISIFGLNATNFFLAELIAVVGPFLAVYLKEQHWSYAQIGIATAIGGFGAFLFQTPAGIICDLVKYRRTLLAVTSIVLSACFVLLPSVAKSIFVSDSLLFITGISNAFFIPLLATLALSLAGPKEFPRIMGQNQSWNHAGNIGAALLALVIVKMWGVVSVFYIMSSVSVIATAFMFLIKKEELDTGIGKDVKFSKKMKEVGKNFKEFFKKPETRYLLLAVTFYHLANTPVLPVLDLYIKDLGGTDGQVAWTVLIAQAAMVPTALLAGRFAKSKGRKWVFAITFIVLPIRILLYTLTKDPNYLLAIQVLDGVAAGIYGVLIVLMCQDITGGGNGFNMLIGMAQTALALGGVLGPLCQGFLTQSLGFRATFVVLAALAAIGAFIFLTLVKETKPKRG